MPGLIYQQSDPADQTLPSCSGRRTLKITQGMYLYLGHPMRTSSLKHIELHTCSLGEGEGGLSSQLGSAAPLPAEHSYMHSLKNSPAFLSFSELVVNLLLPLPLPLLSWLVCCIVGSSPASSWWDRSRPGRAKREKGR